MRTINYENKQLILSTEKKKCCDEEKKKQPCEKCGKKYNLKIKPTK